MKHVAPAAGRHRAVKPRYGRIGVFSSAIVVTLIAVLGGTGVISTDPAVGDPGADLAVVAEPRTPSSTAPASSTVDGETTSPSETGPAVGATVARGHARERDAVDPLPDASGEGTRIVFSEAQQRVWLVDPAERSAGAQGVLASYPVSGSLLKNLEPGTYQVYSRSRHAVGIDDSGTMEYFVRFTQGPSGAAIGFHTIPVKDGKLLQTRAELGTPQSHGCIRQARADAIALWRFAPIGTTVVVTA